jgi:phosphoglycolate phosphatase-like HAD superfamily hydrolase
VGSRDLNRDIREGCVLELTEQLSPTAQREATLIFQEIEQDAIDRMKFMDGMTDLCEWLDENGIQRAVLTRNVERSVHAFHDKLHPTAPFVPAVARNTIHPDHQTNIPPKPHPDAIHYICKEWNCEPSQVIMVGDSLKDDVVAANRAGCASIYLSMGKDNCSGNTNDSTLEEREPTLKVSSLHELKEILVSQYELQKVQCKNKRQKMTSAPAVSPLQ